MNDIVAYRTFDNTNQAEFSFLQRAASKEYIYMVYSHRDQQAYYAQALYDKDEAIMAKLSGHNILSLKDVLAPAKCKVISSLSLGTLQLLMYADEVETLHDI